MIRSEYDVVVIGGGPAGSTVATLLAKKGFEVGLLERQSHPRHTVGENLIPHFWKFADLLGVTSKIIDAKFIVKGGGMVFWNGHLRGMDFNNFGFKRQGLHVEREEFDKILFDHCGSSGVETFEWTKATKIDHSENGLSTVHYTSGQPGEEVVSGTVKARYIVDCSGQATLMAKQSNSKKFDEGFRFHSFYSYYPSMNYFSTVDEANAFEDRYKKKPKTFQKNIGGWGWVWHIVLKNSVSVGLVIPRNDLKHFKSNGSTLNERFKTTIEKDEILSKLMTTSELINDKVYAIKDYSYYTEKQTEGNVFMVGDAGAFVDPINSSGVSMAFYSGFLAASQIENCFKKPNNSEKYKKFYDQTLKIRYNLFKAAARPEEKLTDKMLKSCQTVFKMMSEDELQLIMTQISLTQRSKNMPEFVKQIGTEFQHIYKEVKYEAANYDFHLL